MLALLAGACSETKVNTTLDDAVQKLFAGRRTPQQYMIQAVASEDPDLRRDAVARISKSKDFNREWAIKGFVAIALLESNPQTRCVAIRALTRTGDPRAVDTDLHILNYQNYPPQEVWPPVALCRWDATESLARLSERGQIPDESREVVRATLLERLRIDSDRQTRIAAARGLSNYSDAEVVKTLIDGLRDDEFSVVYECETSLVRLTGQTHNMDPAAWEAWSTEHADDLFASAGEVPESRRPPYNSRLGKMVYDTRELIDFLWPGSKN